MLASMRFAEEYFFHRFNEVRVSLNRGQTCALEEKVW